LYRTEQQKRRQDENGGRSRCAERGGSVSGRTIVRFVGWREERAKGAEWFGGSDGNGIPLGRVEELTKVTKTHRADREEREADGKKTLKTVKYQTSNSHALLVYFLFLQSSRLRASSSSSLSFIGP
jgi:hypothetical protein